MKKLKEAIDKYFVHILFLILLGVGTAMYDYSKRFFSLPKKVDYIESKRMQDSAFAAKYIHKNDSIIRILILNTEDDWDSIKLFSKRMTKNKIQ